MHIPTRPRPSPTRIRYVHFFPVDAPLSSSGVLMCRSLRTFCNHSCEESITHLVIPSLDYRSHPAFYYTHCCPNPTIHWQVPYKFCAQGKSPPCENCRIPRTTLTVSIGGCLPLPLRQGPVRVLCLHNTLDQMHIIVIFALSVNDFSQISFGSIKCRWIILFIFSNPHFFLWNTPSKLSKT